MSAPRYGGSGGLGDGPERWCLLFFPFDGAGEGPFLYKSGYDDAQGDEDEDRRNGPSDKDHEASIRNDHRLPKGHFHQGTQHESQDQRGRLELKPFNQIAENPEGEGDDRVINAVVDAVRTEETEEEDENRKQGLGNRRAFDPEGGQRQVKDQPT